MTIDELQAIETIRSHIFSLPANESHGLLGFANAICDSLVRTELRIRALECERQAEAELARQTKRAEDATADYNEEFERAEKAEAELGAAKRELKESDRLIKILVELLEWIPEIEINGIDILETPSQENHRARLGR